MSTNDKPDLMQTIKERLASTNGGDRAVINIDPNDPNHATVVFKDSKGSVRADLSTKGNSFTLQFNGEMDPQRVKDFQGRIGAVFEHKPLSVNSPDVTYGARGQGMTTRLQPQEIETAQAKVIDTRAKVAATITTFREQETMRGQGYDARLIEAQTSHSLGRIGALDDTHSLLSGRPADSPLMAAARAGQQSFMDMVVGKPAAAATALHGHTPSPELAALLNKPFRPADSTPETLRTSDPALQGTKAAGGGVIQKVVVGGAMAVAGGVAAAAQAPEGQRLEAGVRAGGKLAAEQMLPGVTEKDICKSAGNVGAWLGGGAGAIVGGGGALVATGATAVPTLGASVAASPWTTAAGVVAGGYVGSEIGDKLGEGGCNMVRAAINAIRSENKSQVAHKPEAGKVTAAPDATPATAPASGKGASRG